MRHKREFLYQRLEREVEQKIISGVYLPGDKLPSIRHLQEELNLSVSTISKAYEQLEEKGLVEVREKSGYYVKSRLLENVPSDIDSSVGNRPHKVVLPSFVNQVIETINSPGLLNFGSAVISPELLPHRSLMRILKDMSDSDIKHILSYRPSQGEMELRRQIAMRLLGLVDDIHPDDIIVTNGCMEAVLLALQTLLKEGDTIAIEAPTFHGILPLLEELGVYVVELKTEAGTGVDVEDLLRMLRQTKVDACLLNPNFHNPLGSLMPDGRKEELVEVLNDLEIPIIEIDVSAELSFSGPRPLPLKAFDKKGWVLTCSSFSKTLAPGLRIGWIIPGHRFKQKILKLKTGISVTTSSLDQFLITEFLKRGQYERYIRLLRGRLRKQVLEMADVIQKCFAGNVQFVIPQGGTLLWLKLPREIDGLALYYEALDIGISILPGIVCSSSRQYTNYIRIGCGYPFSDFMKKGLEQLARLIHREC